MIGLTEILVIAILIIILFKPEELPRYLASGKKALKTIRETSAALKADFNETAKSLNDMAEQTINSAMDQAEALEEKEANQVDHK